MRFSKILILALTLLLSAQNFAAELDAKVVLRNKKGKAKERTVKLVNLYDTTAFEGPDFKIVLGKSNEAIKTTCESEKLCKKAATVWYWLTKSKNYFIENLDSQFVRDAEQLTVRLDIDAQFNSIGHFGNPNLPKELNNALSIPGGVARPQNNIEAWGPEIWFRPGKEVKVPTENSATALSIKQMLREFRKQMRVTSFQRFLVEVVGLIGNFTGTALLESSVRFAGTMAVLEVAYGGFNLFTRLFRSTKIFLETALVPEIIAHEYAHIALADTLELSRSAPVNEGMADYFATRIVQNKQIAKKVKKYARIKGKDSENNTQYNVIFETGAYANVDYVLALLFETGKIMGTEQDEFMYQLRRRVSTNSTIRNDLVRNILDQCRDKCSAPRAQRLQLLRMFHSKGL